MIEKWITSLETAPMSVAGWIAGFIGVVWIRLLLETFSSLRPSGYLTTDFPTLLHYTLFYIATIVVLILSTSTITHIPAIRMMRVSVFILPIVWIAPLTDLAYGGARMVYIFADTPQALFHDFSIYFGGLTFGLRTELGILLLILGGYIYLKTKNIFKTFLSVFVGYIVLFVFCAMPSLLSFLMSVPGLLGVFSSIQNSLISHNFLHTSQTYSSYWKQELLFNAGMAQMFYLMLSISGIVFLYQAQKDSVIAVFRNIRPERVLHFVSVVILGALIALSEGSRINWTIFDGISIAVVLLTVVYAWLFAVTTNDLVDEPIDRISNTHRPLVTGSLTKEMMWHVAFISGSMAIVGAFTLGSYATFWILVFSAAYYIYSVPPLRLKRVPILASALIGIATLSMMLLGFYLVSGNQMLIAFPAPIGLLVVLFMTLVANIRDLKDIKGDMAAGINTLPTLLGLKRSRMVIGIMVCIASILVPLFIPVKSLWWLSVVAGIVAWAGIVQGKGERFVFSVYFTYLICVVSLLSLV